MEPSPASTAPYLKRVLGLRDLVLLGIVAVFNLNLVPPVAAGGFPSLIRWGVGLLCLFLPQAVAVAEFVVRYPEEGGVYLWTKKAFGELLSRVHDRWQTPHVALIGQAVASSVVIGLSFAGKDVRLHEACV
jgi:amino acid transporter